MVEKISTIVVRSRPSSCESRGPFIDQNETPMISAMLFSYIRIILFCAASFVSVSKARALVFDANVFYFTDGIAADEDSSHAATYYDILMGFDLDKKGMYQVGWNYSSHGSTTENNGQEVAYKTTTEMGPGFVIYFNKDRSLRFGFAYNYKTIADYEANGASSIEWRGTSMAANFGYQLRFDGAVSLGLRLNYYSAAYTESIDDTTKADISHKKTAIYPSIALTVDSF